MGDKFQQRQQIHVIYTKIVLVCIEHNKQEEVCSSFRVDNWKCKYYSGVAYQVKVLAYVALVNRACFYLANIKKEDKHPGGIE